jgi:hypothetical protein
LGPQASLDLGGSFVATTANSIQLGSGITDVITSGKITAGSVTYPNTHNSTAGQVLSINASGTATWNTPATATVTMATGLVGDEFNATAGQTTFTLSAAPLNNKVWMFVNGTRIKNGAYSVSGLIVTYNPTNNNNYTLVLNDRVQFDYAN